MYDLKYDTPVEVNSKQFHAIRNDYGHVAAHREDKETGKYYIKLWSMQHKNRVEQCLIDNK